MQNIKFYGLFKLEIINIVRKHRKQFLKKFQVLKRKPYKLQNGEILVLKKPNFKGKGQYTEKYGS